MALTISEHKPLPRDVSIADDPIPEPTADEIADQERELDEAGPDQDTPDSLMEDGELPATSTTTTTTAKRPTKTGAVRKRQRSTLISIALPKSLTAPPPAHPKEEDDKEPTKRQKKEDDEEQSDDEEKKSKSESNIDDRTRILDRLRRLIMRGTVGKEDLAILDDCKELLKFLKELDKMETIQLKVLDALLRRRLMGNSPLGDPCKVIQRALARAGGLVKRSATVEQRIENDTVLAVGLDELCGEYVEGLPALIKVGTALMTDLIEIPDPVKVAAPPPPPKPAETPPLPVPPPPPATPVIPLTIPLNGQRSGAPVVTAVANPPPPTKQQAADSGTK